MSTRRQFLVSIAAAPWLSRQGLPSLDIAAIERPRVLAAANSYLAEAPVTITASRCPRSAGGPHDYFSEADYWWPDPQNPGGPYIQRDGHDEPRQLRRAPAGATG